MSTSWDLIIIGGGAAGLWAAGTAAHRGLRVVVLEKNRKPGVKILMSGGTRCNITHDCDLQGIVGAFGQQGRFLKPSLYNLTPADVVAEVNRFGVATKIEDTGKVFPVSDRAIDVRDALLRRLEQAGAQLRSGVAVTGLESVGSSCWRVSTESDNLESSAVLLCCGGLSYPGCGTTGDGFIWARKLGHTIVDTFPALTPLLSPARWVHELSGITVPDAELQVLVDGRKLKEPRSKARGGLLWTHFGVSGPTAMNVSRCVSPLPEPQRACVEIDLLPGQDAAALSDLLMSRESGKRSVLSVLSTVIPRNLAGALLALAEVDAGTLLAELPRKGRQQLLHDLKNLQVPLSGCRGYAKAEVTAGGIDRREVNPHTMESRLAPGLYLAGEILDIDGPIGGFNFQAAFSTGHTAALHA